MTLTTEDVLQFKILQSPNPEGWMTFGKASSNYSVKFPVMKLPTDEQIKNLEETFGIYVEKN